MVVDSCGPLRTSQHFGNLLVRQPLGHPQREHVALHRRERRDRLPDSPGGLFRHDRIESVERCCRVCLSNLRIVPSSSCSPPTIKYQAPLDREEPGSDRAVRPEALDCRERPNERVLYEFFHFIVHPLTGREPCQGRGVPLHQQPCRALVSSAPPPHKLDVRGSIGRGVVGLHRRLVERRRVKVQC